MPQLLTPFLVFVALAAAAFSSPVCAESMEKRVALVIGNAKYEARPLATAANDAGLIAQTLQAAGFDVDGARDLDEDSLRHAFRDFVEKVSASGPDTVAFVYFAGYGLQLEGENYLVPVDATIRRDSDVPSKSVRVSDYVRPLAALGLKVGVVVLDAARANPFSISGEPLAGGLALIEPGANITEAFNAAPGTVAPDETGSYGAYAQALAEMIREGGLSLGEMFDRVRLRVNEATKGAQLPWNSSPVETSFVFFQRSADAPPPPDGQASAVRSKPIRSLGARDGYLAAVEKDTLPAYEEYVGAYPRDPMANRVRAIVAARREAIIWRRTRNADTPNAYWTYLRRYPHGPHAWDARRRLSEIAAALEPPPSFDMIDYDVPPPPPEEIIYVDRPAIAFYDPVFDFPPPPPLPVYFLPPPPPEFVVLPPPIIIVEEAFVLPVPVFVPIPVFINRPRFVAPPPDNLIFNNIHNTVIVNNTTNNLTVKNPDGHVVSSAPLRPGGAAAGGAGAAVAVSLPPAVARKAGHAVPAGAPRPGVAPGAGPGPGHGPGVSPSPVPALGKGTPGQPLPGMGGHALPPVPGKPPGAPSAGVPAKTPAPGAPAPALGVRQPGSPPVPGKPAGGPATGAGPKPPTAGAPATLPGGHKLPPPPVPGKPAGGPATGAGPKPPTAGPPAPGARQPSPPVPGKPAGGPVTGAGPKPPTAGAPAPAPGARQPSPPVPGKPAGGPATGAGPKPPTAGAPATLPGGHKLPPPGRHALPPQPSIHAPPHPPAASRPPPPAPSPGPTQFHRPPPPVMRAPPPAAKFQRPPPPVMRAPPPQPVYRPPPVMRAPPPQPVYRPPPPVYRPPSPAPQFRNPAPPMAPRAAPQSQKSCQFVGGVPVCR